MNFQQDRNEPQRDLDYSITPNHHQKKILKFLQNNFSIIAGILTGKAIVDLTTKKEDEITGEIVNLLNDKLRSLSTYLFRFEAKKGPDILIFASPYEPFSPELFIIEAKRLPSTSNRDYVRTGIERFKREEHGKQHDIACMLGYIQDKDFCYWHKKVNSWIDDLISKADKAPKWEEHDKLRRAKVTNIGEYESTHSRISTNAITLHHFWINLHKSSPN